jgi:hypothetical protein
LFSQSNAIAVEDGRRTAEDAAGWLAENMRPFYGLNTKSTFLFGGTINYLQNYD